MQTMDVGCCGLGAVLAYAGPLHLVSCNAVCMCVHAVKGSCDSMWSSNARRKWSRCMLLRQCEHR